MVLKLNFTYKNRIINYLKKEPEVNLFSIYLLNNYKESLIDIWADIDIDFNISFVLIKYKDVINFYCTGNYDKDVVLDIIKDLNYEQIQGKKQDLELISNELSVSEVRQVKLCSIESVNNNSNNKLYNVKKINISNINKVVSLYKSIGEFEDVNRKYIKDILKSGRGYFVQSKSEAVSMAKSTYETSTHAMIVGVGTKYEYRKLGYARKCVETLCEELINCKKTPCLMYENKIAGKMYESIGFKKIADWSIYYK